jgi:hypothetical protein
MKLGHDRNGDAVSPPSVPFSSLFLLFDFRVSRQKKKRGGRPIGPPITMVMMFVGGGGVGAWQKQNSRLLFLLYKTYSAGVFCSRPNPYRGKAVKTRTSSLIKTST